MAYPYVWLVTIRISSCSVHRCIVLSSSIVLLLLFSILFVFAEVKATSTSAASAPTRWRAYVCIPTYNTLSYPCSLTLTFLNHPL